MPLNLWLDVGPSRLVIEIPLVCRKDTPEGFLGPVNGMIGISAPAEHLQAGLAVFHLRESAPE